MLSKQNKDELYYIFYHIFLFGNWYPVVKEQLDKLEKNGLIKISRIKIGVVYYPSNKSDIETLNELISDYKNCEVMFVKENSSLAEAVTLTQMKLFSDSCDINQKILYFHTKGVSHFGTKHELPCRNWRHMMEYFLIEKWKDCVDRLNEGYDCCGINYQDHAIQKGTEYVLGKIFNGNFFWVNSDYIKKIDKNFVFRSRFDAENWILSVDHNVYSVYDTPNKINLYEEEFKNYK